MDECIENCFQQLGRTKGGDFCQQVRVIVEINLKNGRVDFEAGNHCDLVCAYIDRVAVFYEAHHEEVKRVLEERNYDVWAKLSALLEQWARIYLHRKWPATPHEVILDLSKIVAQEAAERICKNFFPYDTPFEAWVRVFVQNVARETMRRYLRDSNRTDQVGEEDVLDFLEDEKFDILDNFLMKEKTELMVEAIASLPEGQREVIELHYLSYLSFAEIAIKLNISGNSVYQRHFHAFKNLRKFVEERNK